MKPQKPEFAYVRPRLTEYLHTHYPNDSPGFAIDFAPRDELPPHSDEDWSLFYDDSLRDDFEEPAPRSERNDDEAGPGDVDFELSDGDEEYSLAMMKPPAIHKQTVAKLQSDDQKYAQVMHAQRSTTGSQSAGPSTSTSNVGIQEPEDEGQIDDLDTVIKGAALQELGHSDSHGETCWRGALIILSSRHHLAVRDNPFAVACVEDIMSEPEFLRDMYGRIKVLNDPEPEPSKDSTTKMRILLGRFAKTQQFGTWCEVFVLPLVKEGIRTWAEFRKSGDSRKRKAAAAPTLHADLGIGGSRNAKRARQPSSGSESSSPKKPKNGIPEETRKRLSNIGSFRNISAQLSTAQNVPEKRTPAEKEARERQRKKEQKRRKREQAGAVETKPLHK